jgi:SAM-dependent methyltransferase
VFWKSRPTPAQIAAGFRKRDPWVTRFTINGQVYGGGFDADNDIRIPQFFEIFPDVREILELGCLEGGQTLQLAKQPAVRITAIEARRMNLDKARYVAELLEVTNVRFVQMDLEKQPLRSLGQFDVVFCSGVLYHLPRPWELLDSLRAVAPRVFLWTHYASPDKVTETLNGFPGHWYQEHGKDDPLSGMSPKSFWITLPSILERLRHNGFESLRLIEDNPQHPNGPSVTLAAWAGDA